MEADGCDVKKVKSEPELNAYLSRKNIPEGGFSLKGVGDEDIKKIIKKMKGKSLMVWTGFVTFH